MIESYCMNLQAKLHIKMKIRRWSNKKRNIMNELQLIEKKIPFIYINAGRLAISGFTNTIDGEYEIYVVGVRNILKKIDIHYALPDAICSRERRIRNNNLMIILFQQTPFPRDIINEILSFSP